MAEWRFDWVVANTEIDWGPRKEIAPETLVVLVAWSERALHREW